MTETEKIKRLAEWMGEGTSEGYDPRIMLGVDGRYYVGVTVLASPKNAKLEYKCYRVWKPLSEIDAAWLLLMEIEKRDKEEPSIMAVDIAEWWLAADIFAMTAPEAARAISKFVLEMIEVIDDEAN